jgi:hypothetical protein
MVTREFWEGNMKIGWLVFVGLLTLAPEAQAQCAPDAKVFIDPRLVPMRPHISYQQMHDILANPWQPQPTKDKFLQLYMEQNQPIQVPFRNGIVLVNPTNPCIQQYTGN